jgi:hypothetical protein
VLNRLATYADGFHPTFPDKLAAAGFASMILFTVVNVTDLLVTPRPAPRVSVSYGHDQRIDL